MLTFFKDYKNWLIFVLSISYLDMLLTGIAIKKFGVAIEGNKAFVMAYATGNINHTIIPILFGVSILVLVMFSWNLKANDEPIKRFQTSLKIASWLSIPLYFYQTVFNWVIYLKYYTYAPFYLEIAGLI